MVKPQHVTYTPGPDGGEVTTDMQVGPAGLTLTWPVRESSKPLKDRFEQLQVKVRKFTFSATGDGNEVQFEMEAGGHAFTTNVKLSDENGFLNETVAELLQGVDEETSKHLESLLKDKSPSSGASSNGSSSPGGAGDPKGSTEPQKDLHVGHLPDRPLKPVTLGPEDGPDLDPVVANLRASDSSGPQNLYVPRIS